MKYIIRAVILFVVGIWFILAGINGWDFPSIYWFWRKEKYGEFMNSVVCISLGICFIGASFSMIKYFLL